MTKEGFEQALSALTPSKRTFLKGIVAGAAFAIPTITSFPVRDLAFGQVGTGITTTTVTTSTIITTTPITTTPITTTPITTTNG